MLQRSLERLLEGKQAPSKETVTLDQHEESPVSNIAATIEKRFKSEETQNGWRTSVHQ
jgi:hypothetical protein